MLARASLQCQCRSHVPRPVLDAACFWMGTRSRIKVRAPGLPALLLALGAALLASSLAPRAAAGAAVCPRGQQFWDAARALCRDCSTCRQPGHIVLRPCHVHQDTQCGPVRHIDVDRAWPRARGDSAPAVVAPVAAAPPTQRPRAREHRPRQSDHWHRRKGARWGSTSSSSAESSSWSTVVNGNGSSHREVSSSRRFHKHWHHSNSSGSEGSKQRQKQYAIYHHHHHHHHHHHRQKARPPESAAQLRGAEAPGAVAAAAAPPTARTPPPHPPPHPPPRTPEPFTAVEAFAWDWQAAALVAAVAGCALFFGAAAVHGLRQLRRDAGRSADADNLSATLSLMVPEITNDIPDSCTVDGCNTNQCLYMEQLLVRKHEELKEGQGNVYIDRGNSKMKV